MSDTHVLPRPQVKRPSHGKARAVPREHGFWVMLAVVLLSACIRVSASPAALALAFAIATGAVIVAGRVGRLLRKRPELQATASLVLAASGWPVLLVGGESAPEASLFSGAFGVLFLAGAFAVQAVLDRARKRPERAAVAAAASIALPAIASAGFLMVSLSTAAGVALTGIYALFLFAWQPAAKKLKTIGWTLALCHVMSGVLIAL